MTAHRFHSPIAVFGQLWGRRSLSRSLFHLALRDYTVVGRILDLGSKTADQEYYRYLHVEGASEIVPTDLVPSQGILVLNVEERFPLPDCSFDTVLAFQLVEHVYRFDHVPHEVGRVLKSGGRVLVSAPFLYEYHPDPEDYFRFTDVALRRLWESAGLKCLSMEAIGEGVLTSAITRLAHLGLPVPFRGPAAAILYLPTTLMDRALDALRPPIHGKRMAARFALGHVAVFEKP